MFSRTSALLALGTLLGTTAMVPLAIPMSIGALADPASSATVPDASAIKPTPTPTDGQTSAAKSSAAKPSAAKAESSAATSSAAKSSAAESTDATSVTKSDGASPDTTRDAEMRRRAQRRADREAFFAAHLAALHAGLALQPDQEALWPPVESAIRDLAKARAERWRMRHPQFVDGGAKATSKTTADDKSNGSVERLLAHGENMTRMGNAIQGLAHATTPLLASLTPAQKDRLPILVEGLKPPRLMARAFDLDDDGMREGAMAGRRHDDDGGGQGQAGDHQSGDDGFGNHRWGGDHFGLSFNENSRRDFMPGGRHPDERDGDGYSQDFDGRYGAPGDQPGFMGGYGNE